MRWNENKKSLFGPLSCDHGQKNVAMAMDNSHFSSYSEKMQNSNFVIRDGVRYTPKDNNLAHLSRKYMTISLGDFSLHDLVQKHQLMKWIVCRLIGDCSLIDMKKLVLVIVPKNCVYLIEIRSIRYVVSMVNGFILRIDLSIFVSNAVMKLV